MYFLIFMSMIELTMDTLELPFDWRRLFLPLPLEGGPFLSFQLNLEPIDQFSYLYIISFQEAFLVLVGLLWVYSVKEFMDECHKMNVGKSNNGYLYPSVVQKQYLDDENETYFEYGYDRLEEYQTIYFDFHKAKKLKIKRVKVDEEDQNKAHIISEEFHLTEPMYDRFMTIFQAKNFIYQHYIPSRGLQPSIYRIEITYPNQQPQIDPKTGEIDFDGIKPKIKVFKIVKTENIPPKDKKQIPNKVPKNVSEGVISYKNQLLLASEYIKGNKCLKNQFNNFVSEDTTLIDEDHMKQKGPYLETKFVSYRTKQVIEVDKKECESQIKQAFGLCKIIGRKIKPIGLTLETIFLDFVQERFIQIKKIVTRNLDEEQEFPEIFKNQFKCPGNYCDLDEFSFNKFPQQYQDMLHSYNKRKEKDNAITSTKSSKGNALLPEMKEMQYYVMLKTINSDEVFKEQLDMYEKQIKHLNQFKNKSMDSTQPITQTPALQINTSQPAQTKDKPSVMNPEQSEQGQYYKQLNNLFKMYEKAQVCYKCYEMYNLLKKEQFLEASRQDMMLTQMEAQVKQLRYDINNPTHGRSGGKTWDPRNFQKNIKKMLTNAFGGGEGTKSGESPSYLRPTFTKSFSTKKMRKRQSTMLNRRSNSSVKTLSQSQFRVSKTRVRNSVDSLATSSGVRESLVSVQNMDEDVKPIQEVVQRKHKRQLTTQSKRRKKRLQSKNSELPPLPQSARKESGHEVMYVDPNSLPPLKPKLNSKQPKQTSTGKPPSHSRSQTTNPGAQPNNETLHRHYQTIEFGDNSRNQISPQPSTLVHKTIKTQNTPIKKFHLQNSPHNLTLEYSQEKNSSFSTAKSIKQIYGQDILNLAGKPEKEISSTAAYKSIFHPTKKRRGFKSKRLMLRPAHTTSNFGQKPDFPTKQPRKKSITNIKPEGGGGKDKTAMLKYQLTKDQSIEEVDHEESENKSQGSYTDFERESQNGKEPLNIKLSKEFDKNSQVTQGEVKPSESKVKPSAPKVNRARARHRRNQSHIPDQFISQQEKKEKALAVKKFQKDFEMESDEGDQDEDVPVGKELESIFENDGQRQPLSPQSFQDNGSNLKNSKKITKKSTKTKTPQKNQKPQKAPNTKKSDKPKEREITLEKVEQMQRNAAEKEQVQVISPLPSVEGQFPTFN